MTKLSVYIFVVLWILTFFPAWKLLLRLLALSVSDRKIDSKFISLFILYRLVIVLPYIALLLFGRSLPGLVKDIVVGVISLSLILSVARFFLRRQATMILWSLYSLFYDGLLQFFPYNHLLELVLKRLDQKDIKVLDAGCGTGNVAYRLSAQKNISIKCVDSNGAMLRVARKKLRQFPNIKILQTDIIDYLADSDEKFDAIVMINVLYAVENTGDLWKLALRRLNKSGKIVVTNSDRGGSWPITKEHLAHSNFFKLLHPKLLGVFVIDYFISQLAAAGTFNFISQKRIEKEVKSAGGAVIDLERCYGGPIDGVNLLFTVTPML